MWLGQHLATEGWREWKKSDVSQVAKEYSPRINLKTDSAAVIGDNFTIDMSTGEKSTVNLGGSHCLNLTEKAIEVNLCFYKVRF